MTVASARIVSLLLVFAAATACGGEQDTTIAEPETPAAAKASTRGELSKALGCTSAPGTGTTKGTGATQYFCVGQNIGSGKYAFMVFFDSRGAKEVYARQGAQYAQPGAAGEQKQVVGPDNWVVWGNVDPVIVAAVNLGGTQS